jgi:DNA helicase-2/ATP-dependent DNA helicase PcrA
VAEAAGVATAAAKLIAGGTRPSEIAVLYRTNAQSEPLEQALAEVGVPYLVRGGERFFARREVRDAIVLLRGAARAADPAQPLADAAREALGAAGWSADPPASGSGAVRERWESLQALAALADELAATRPDATLADLVTELDERAAAQHAPTVEGVTLASLHAAKGLEWDAVFLVGLTEGLLPISFAEGVTAVEEERRLLYVGVTRAREHLALSWARARTPGGRATRKPSRFLDGLRPVDPAVDETRSAAARSGGRRGRGRPMPTTCRTCGKALTTGAERKVGRCSSCPPTYDEATFEALRAWRLETAGEAKVPAYVVFTDATLTAIAEARPESLGELAGIAGVGATKLERYGPAVLALLEGSTGSADRKDPAAEPS